MTTYSSNVAEHQQRTAVFFVAPRTGRAPQRGQDGKEAPTAGQRDLTLYAVGWGPFNRQNTMRVVSRRVWREDARTWAWDDEE
jgi:hypothetical protein